MYEVWNAYGSIQVRRQIIKLFIIIFHFISSCIIINLMRGIQNLLLPFLLASRLADLVGFGVAVATGMQYLENFPDRVYKSMLIPLMMEDKRAGKIY